MIKENREKQKREEYVIIIRKRKNECISTNSRTLEMTKEKRKTKTEKQIRNGFAYEKQFSTSDKRKTEKNDRSVRLNKRNINLTNINHYLLYIYVDRKISCF